MRLARRTSPEAAASAAAAGSWCPASSCSTLRGSSPAPARRSAASVSPFARSCVWKLSQQHQHQLIGMFFEIKVEVG
jgi:hypothetical protein